MNQRQCAIIYAAFLQLFWVSCVSACTGIVVEKSATTDGSTLTAHTNDCRQCDFRMGYIPANDHKEGSRRNVYALRPEYPRYVGNEWGPMYSLENIDTTIYPWTESTPIGHTDEVEHTYAYLDAPFPIINEHQVAMGESTCSGKLYAFPRFAGGRALFDMTALTRIALERCKTARCAIVTIGSLAEEHGFYGEDWGGNLVYEYSEAGEGMAIADSEEAWVMNILPDDTGTSAVWAAQRVPKGHIAVIVNEFTIKEMDLSRPDEFLASSNVHDVAIRQGFWSPKDGAFNFMRAYTWSNDTKRYSGRRQWRLLSMAAPSLKLDPNTSIFDLPFSVPVDEQLSPKDIMKMMRDHFEGTPYDQTKGLAAGPFGDPNRYDRGNGSGAPSEYTQLGQFERSVSIFRASFSYVTQSRSWLPDWLGAKVWFGHYAPHATAYVPFYVSGSIPDSFSQGSLHKMDRGSFWAFLTVGNWADKMYKYIMEDVTAEADKIEKAGAEKSHRAEQRAAQIYQEHRKNGDHEKYAIKEARKELTNWANSFADGVVERWWQFFELIVVKWHDNYRMEGLHEETIRPVAMFWPQWWLEAVGYYSPEVLAQIKANESRTETAMLAADLSNLHTPSAFLNVLGALLLLVAAAFLAGLYVGSNCRKKRSEYTALDES